MKLAPTKITLLVSLLVLATALGWCVNQLWPTWFNQSPSVPWLAAYMLVLLALLLLGWALHVKASINPEPGKPRIHPILAARTVALAMAASRVGSLACGVYLGFVLASVSNLDTPAGRQRAMVSGVAAIAGLAMAVIAIWLERICQIPQPPRSATHSGAEQGT